MTRDIVRAACVVVVLAVAASLVIEVRWQLACIDAAHRGTLAAILRQSAPAAPAPAPPPAPPGRLRAFGRAVLDLADAGLGVVR
jgi:hypothetical protein